MVVEKAYAKINLGLEVVRKREDSYHDLAMVMTSISLSDELFFEEKEADVIVIECDAMKHIQLEDNLIYKAAKIIKSRYNIKKGVKVKVVKNIPEKAGLGGGSADAAATLRGLNKLFNLNLSLDELAKIAIELGSDVPFCIYNKTAKVTGKGEVIEFIDEVPYLNLILIFPPFKASTKDVFNSFKIHGRNKGKINSLIEAIRSKDLDDICNNIFNDLEYSYFYNDIAKIKSSLISQGAKTAFMTGSGSTVVGVCINEKDAKNVLHKFLSNNKAMHGVLVQTRSNIKYVWSGQARMLVKYKTLDTLKTKVNGYIKLAYQAIYEDHIVIETPINISSEIIVEKINHKISEVYVNEYIIDNTLSKYLEKIVSILDYGLRIKINLEEYSGYNIFSDENYLAQIIKLISESKEEENKLFGLFNKKVEAYKELRTFCFDSRKNELKLLNDAPFGYVLITDLGIKEYKNPKYTKQIEVGKEINEILDGISERNFYKVAENLYNSLSKFEVRAIEEVSKLNIGRLRYDAYKHGASGFIIGVDGRSIITLVKNEKRIKSLLNAFNNFYNLKRTVSTSIKSSISHKVSESKVLTEIILPKDNFGKNFIEPNDQIEKLDYNIYDYDDYSNPFAEEKLDLFDDEIKIQKKNKKKRNYVEANKDIEGILYIHSGGSLFKFYDFVDIARYFEKYFHNKQIEFEINNEKYIVGFKVNHLPHLLGIHKINTEDESLKGLSGYEKLINGEILYRDLKNKLDKKIFDQINTRTQGSVLIFNDIYHGRDKEFICYDKDKIIFKEDSKLKAKLRYGITRGVARNEFHKRNVLGIGYEENSNLNYFITSFLWEAKADLGKKEGYRVKIVKH